MPFIARGKFPTGGDTLALESHLTTGSMSVASTTLTVVSNPGFQIGDAIIVEIGGEVGAGLRGTIGVGGVWPALHYANAAAMNADSGQAANTFAWLDDTGTVYQYVSSVWTQIAVSQYYTQKAVPRSLVTTITNISGNTFTLANASTAATTNAIIYFDNRAIINTALQGAAPTNDTHIIPAGSYAISGRLNVPNVTGRTIRGFSPDKTVSEIFSPHGVDCAQFLCNVVEQIVIRDFSFRGNVGLNGFGLAWSTNEVTEILLTQGSAFPRGIWFQLGVDCLLYNMKMTDCFHMAAGASLCRGIHFKRIDVYLTEPMPQYVQWQVLFADSDHCYAHNIFIDSSYLTGGFGAFRSWEVGFYGVTTRNASCDANTAGLWTYADINVTIEQAAQYPAIAPQVNPGFHINNGIFAINSNILNTSGTEFWPIDHGGELYNFEVIFEGPTDAALTTINSAVIINSGVNNVRISNGYIEHPNNITKLAATGIGCQGSYVIIDNVEVVGENLDTDWGNIHISSPAVFGTVKNSTMHKLVNAVPGAVNTNNTIT